MRKDIFVSTVIQSKNGIFDIDNIKSLYNYLKETYNDFEIIIVTEKLNSNIDNNLDCILNNLSSIRVISISKLLSDEVAFGAGAENAIGDIIVLVDISETPIETINSAIKICHEGSDLVIGTSDSNQSYFYKALSLLFRKIIAKHANYFIPKDATNLRVVSRRSLNVAISKERLLYQFYLNLSLASINTKTISYKAINTIEKKIITGTYEAIKVLVFNSTMPLRVVSILGFFGSLLGFSISIYSLVIHFFKDKPVEGWVSINLFISSQFILIFIILFFFGEYLSRIISELREKSDYEIVSEEYISLPTNEVRRNVTVSS